MIFKCSIKDKYGKGKERKQHSQYILPKQTNKKKKYVTKVKASLFPIHVALEAEA